MKKNLFIIIGISILIFLIIFFLNKKNNSIKNINIVDIKVILNKDCNKCTTLDSYLEVYKKSGVKFGKIKQIDYTSREGKKLLGKYNIKKLPFIIFSKNLEKYETIAISWDNTFGYKNNMGEYIPTDIIPPYFNIKTKKIEGLIDMTYISNFNCKKCYLPGDVKKILNTFGLRFKNIKSISKKTKIGKELIQKYNIDIFPSVILSSNLNLYKSFSYFWKNIGTVEKDNKYILRKPNNLGLKFQLIGN